MNMECPHNLIYRGLGCWLIGFDREVIDSEDSELINKLIS
jgi:hypothetical protein